MKSLYIREDVLGAGKKLLSDSERNYLSIMCRDIVAGIHLSVRFVRVQDDLLSRRILDKISKAAA